ncbi:MAG: metal-dependent hydrolase [Undibacterium sp.]|nr:metal-dependent hydrolase [Opitutaceae bacterium]
MRVTSFGHSCFRIEVAGVRLVIDPYLSENPILHTEPADVPCDYVLCTHAHSDHICDALTLARLHHATIVAPYALAEHFAADATYPATLDLMPGGGINLPWGRIQMTPAIHSSSLEFGDGETQSMGVASGYLIKAAGRTLYHAGDTALFGDMSLIGRHGLDLALIPIGDFYTMRPADALYALDLLRPKLTVRLHYNTNDKIRVDAPAFARDAATAGHTARLLAPGESFDL